MVADGRHVLANEASSWPQGQFTSAVLAVTRKLLNQRPAVATDLLKGQVQANQFINADKTEAEGLAGNELAAALGQGALPAPLPDVLQPRAGQVEDILRSLHITEPGMLLRAAAIDEAARDC